MHSSSIAMDLYVVRHGETALNTGDRYLGALDPPLTPEGVLQAQAIARLLPCRDAHIVTSPLMQAMQTAQILSDCSGSPVRTMDQFAERNVGVFEGLTHAEARQSFPELWERNITRRWDEAPPGGETIEQVFGRVADGLNILRKELRTEPVILVAHGFVGKVIRALLLSLYPEDFFAYQLRNGEYAHYEMVFGTAISVDGLRYECQ